MNKDIRDNWVAALRSGMYKQGTGVLRQKSQDGRDGFCCLGVLCDVYDPDPEWIDPGPGRSSYEYGDQAMVGALPYALQETFGMDGGGRFDVDSLPAELKERILNVDSDSARYFSGIRCVSLADLNDHGASFELIADIIEADPKWVVM